MGLRLSAREDATDVGCVAEASPTTLARACGSKLNVSRRDLLRLATSVATFELDESSGGSTSVDPS